MGVRWRTEGRAHVRGGRRPSSRGDRRADAAGDVLDVVGEFHREQMGAAKDRACACSTISAGDSRVRGAATPKTAHEERPGAPAGIEGAAIAVEGWFVEPSTAATGSPVSTPVYPTTIPVADLEPCNLHVDDEEWPAQSTRM